MKNCLKCYEHSELWTTSFSFPPTGGYSWLSTVTSHSLFKLHYKRLLRQSQNCHKMRKIKKSISDIPFSGERHFGSGVKRGIDPPTHKHKDGTKNLSVRWRRQERKKPCKGRKFFERGEREFYIWWHGHAFNTESTRDTAVTPDSHITWLRFPSYPTRIKISRRRND